MQTIHSQIETKIKKSSKGKIFFAEDFLQFGFAENMRQILRRLEEQGVLIRLVHDIYLVPKKDELLGTVYPSIEEIALEITQRDKARIAPTGVMAIYLLGLSTQIPLHAVYLTDGAQREIKIGKSIIKNVQYISLFNVTEISYRSQINISRASIFSFLV